MNESQASPLTSAHPEVGSAKTHQSLLTLPPSIWWAAVAIPQTKQSGKSMAGMIRTVAADRLTGRPWS